MRSCSFTPIVQPSQVNAVAVFVLSAGLAGILTVGLVGRGHGFDKPNAERPATTVLTPAEERLKRDVNFLADDARDGRAPGTKGIEAAADYIAAVFKDAGLKPAPGARSYFQPFSISGRPRLGAAQELVLTGPNGTDLKGQFKSDFTPMSLGIGATVRSAPIVFAGYGITAKDDDLKLDYDDYAGFDVKGKAVLLIRREPQQANETSRFDGTKLTRYATFQHKATNAFQHGAIAVLMVNDEAGLKGEKDALAPFGTGGDDANSNVPFVMVTRLFADTLLKAAGTPSLSQLESDIDKDLKPQTRELKGWALNETISIERHGIETKNVVGVLEGVGPHADETVVIGGHYDHLGHGGMTSGSLAVFSSEIHNGADDNASGTAEVLELARRLSARRDPLPRRVVFIAFSGEEKGLLGSRYYVSNPLFPLSSTVMMINCDMVGRLNNKDELTMVGTGTTPGMDALVDVLGKSAGLRIKKVAGTTDGFGGSDHESFYDKKIPVLFAFTGIHTDYHRPSDDSDKINYLGMARIADYLELIALDVVRRPDRPIHVAVKEPRGPRRSAASAATGKTASGPNMASLGIMPDYAHEANDGLALAGVRAGGPAASAGLKEGDLIVKMGGLAIGTIYDYMDIMNKHKPGDKVEVVVKRSGKDVTLPVTLGSRARE